MELYSIELTVQNFGCRSYYAYVCLILFVSDAYMADKVAYFNVNTTIRGLNTQNEFSIDIGLVFLHKVYLNTNSPKFYSASIKYS